MAKIALWYTFHKADKLNSCDRRKWEFLSSEFTGTCSCYSKCTLDSLSQCTDKDIWSPTQILQQIHHFLMPRHKLWPHTDYHSILLLHTCSSLSLSLSAWVDLNAKSPKVLSWLSVPGQPLTTRLLGEPPEHQHLQHSKSCKTVALKKLEKINYY